MKSVYAAMVMLLLINTAAQAQQVKAISLKQQKVAYTPKNFYVAAVKDDRADTGSIGIMRAGLVNSPTPVTLEGGTAAAIERFIAANVRQPERATPVEIHIDAIEIAESRQGIRERLDLNSSLSFYYNGEKLITYSGGAYAQTTGDVSSYIEQLIRQNIERSLSEFDAWWRKNKSDITAAPQVNVSVAFSQKAPGKDQIVYDPERLLTLEDFKGPPDVMSIGSAATYSGISSDISASTKGKVTDIQVTLAVLMDKQKSWTKPEGRNAYVLGHEQLHFDITALHGYRLAKRLREAKLPAEGYMDILKEMIRENQEAISSMQDQYDTETNHGIIKAVQAEWAERVKQELATALQ